MSKPTKAKAPAPEPTELQTIDPTALAVVSGGAGNGTDPAVMQALTGVLDSLKSLSQNNQQGGMDPTMMMMMMMMMGGRTSAPAAAAAPSGTFGVFAGYTVDGVFYPFK
jgi:hypothetical protein